MTSIFQIDENNDMWQMLPGGVYILARHQYSQAEVEGITAVSVASIISVLAITMLLFAILVSLIQDWRNPGQKRASRHAFIKSHAGIYFICMLISTLICILGFMLSLIWVVDRAITFGTFCTVQAALKQFGNVATALWVLAIAVHTFFVVFLQKAVPNWVFWIVFVTVWLLSASIIAAGPMIYVTEEMGPWYGISGQWCWTSDSYFMPRFTTEYFWIFLTAVVSFMLYTLLYLKLRGHISDGYRFTFRPRPVGPETSRVAGQMLWYPVVYFFLVFPIAGCRIYEIITMMQANLAIKMASAVLFMLSGLVNVILYTSTRNIFRLSQLVPKPMRRFFGGLAPQHEDGFQQVKDTPSPSLPIFTAASSNYGSGSETLSGGSSPTEKRGSSSLDSNSSFGSEKIVKNADSPIHAVGPGVPTPPPESYQDRTGSLHKSNSLLSFQSSRSFMGSKATIGLDKSGKTVIKKPQPAARPNSNSSSRPNSRQGSNSPQPRLGSGSGSPLRSSLSEHDGRTRTPSPTELTEPAASYRIDLNKIPVRGQSKGAIERQEAKRSLETTDDLERGRLARSPSV